MYPILFEIPGLGFPLRSFGLMVVLGFLLGTHLLGRLAPTYADDPEQDAPGYAALPVWVLLGVMLGARMLYVIVEIGQGTETGQGYRDNPLTIFAYWKGGLVMYGGFFGAFAAVWACCKRHKLRMPPVADLAVVSSFASLFVGRIGCYLVGDDFGSIVPAGWENAPFPLSLRVPEDHLHNHPESLFGTGNLGQTLWATQIWMSMGALFLTWWGMRLMKRRQYKGQVALKLMFVYSIIRGIIEHFRGDGVRGLWFGDTISTSQLISIVVGLICLLLLWRNRALGAEPAVAGADAKS